MSSKCLGWILHRFSDDDKLNVVMNEHHWFHWYHWCDKPVNAGREVVKYVNRLVCCPNWEVRFAILEPSVVFFIIFWLCFVLKSLSSITKNRFVSKILSKVSSKLPVNVSNSPWNWLVDAYNPVDTRRRIDVL